jgi:hypothetical protein
MTLAKICSRDAAQATPQTLISSIVRTMRDRNIGSVVIVDDARRPIGIVTDRDLAIRVLEPGLDPKATLADAVMTRNVRTMPASASANEALETMRQLGVRRLPVVGVRGELFGIVSVDDVLQRVAEELGSLSLVLAHSVGGARLPVRRGNGVSKDGSPMSRSQGEAEC